MSISYNYNPEKDAIYGTIEGRITFEEFQLTLAKITETESFPSGTRMLWDLRKMDFANVDWDFIKQLVNIRELNPKRARSKSALVADNDIDFGITEMYVFQSNRPAEELMAFRDFEKGEKWLLGQDSGA